MEEAVAPPKNTEVIFMAEEFLEKIFPIIVFVIIPAILVGYVAGLGDLVTLVMILVAVFSVIGLVIYVVKVGND